MAFTPSYDETREPLEVFAIDEKMNRATGSIPYRSLRWVRRYCEPGEFEMVVPANIYSPSWAFIYTDSRPEMGIIQKVEYQDDSQVYGGIDSVTLSGYFFEIVLDNIVFLVESPEEQKVYVPEPKRPYFQHSKNDSKVYTDGVGTYYYENKSGTYTNATTGQTFTNADGLSEVDYKPAYGNMYGNEDVGITSYDYYTDSSHEQVTVVPYNPDAGTKTYDILFEDDRGNAYYLNDYGRVTQAVGVVDSYQDTYTARKRSWNALDGDEYGKYYTVTVKGPWQRTDALEPITEGDSIEIVLNWARRMMGDWILYEEPEIEGVQKAVDPSFQYLGDLLYSTLWEVGASLRLEYLFDKNIFILSVYRGFDRTQIEDAEPVAAMTLPTTLAEVDALPEVAPLSDGQTLPDGYIPVEYVESDGTQYVDTGVTAGSATSFTLDVETFSDSASGNHHLMSATTGSQMIVLRVTSGGTGYSARFGSAALQSLQLSGEVFGRHTFELSNGEISVDGGQTTSFSAGSFDTGLNLYLCGLNSSGSYVQGTHMRVYSLAASDGSTSTDMTPCVRRSDGKAGLYDSVSGTFVAPSGGNMKPGTAIDPVLPDGYTKLVYIESTGTQYVDTGYKADQDTLLRGKFYITNVDDAGGTTGFVGFGAYAAGNTRMIGTYSWNQQYEVNFGNTYWFAGDMALGDTFELEQDGRDATVKINGTTYTHQFDSVTFETPGTVYVMGYNSTGGAFTGKQRCYSFEMVKDGATARSLVPAKRDSDGAVGFYDLISGQFLGNNGTGTFIAGPEVQYPAKLTYYPNSATATGEVAAQEGHVGDSVTVAQNGYTDPNKIFLHWGTLPTGGTTYQPGSSYVLTGMTDALYAQWQDNGPEPPEPTPTGGKAPWAVFSDTWGTIYGYDAIRDESNYKNTCYTLYEYDKPSGFDSDGLPSAGYRKVFADTPSGDGVYNITGVEVYIPYTTVRGYYTSRIGEDDEPDIETYLDLRSEKPSCDNQWSRDSVTVDVTSYGQIANAVEQGRAQLLAQGDGSAMPTATAYDEWDQDLQTRGETYLKESYGVETTLDTGTVNTRDYLRGWDLGDLVEFEVSTVGLAEQARITEVEEVYESGKVSVNVTVGDSQLLRTKTGGA